MTDFIMTYRKLVMSGDENHAKSLFGGTLMQWADEATVLYAMCQMGTQAVVTLKVSEILFKNPSKSGDILEFWTRTIKTGRTSLTVECAVIRKDLSQIAPKPKPPIFDERGYVGNQDNVILNCEFVFVSVDESGRPVAHKLGGGTPN